MRRRNASSKAATLVAVVALAASVSSSSPGFPGTIQPPPYPKSTKGDPEQQLQKGSSSSDDEAEESSSDWDDALIMEEDPLAFVVDNVETMNSLSSDGDDADNESEHEGDGKESTEIKVVPPPPPPPLQNAQQQQQSSQTKEQAEESSLESVQSSLTSEPSSTEQELQQIQSSDATEDSKTAATQQELPKPPPRNNGPRTSNHPDRHPSNKKPLQTLEKLQQLLDDTDYLTSSSSADQPPFQNTAQNNPIQQKQQQQLAAPKSSSPSSLRGINSLWTSKDRTKYKKQQRLQKEQIRLKQQQEEQLRKQQQQQQFSLDTEELSDTDDGLGYTLPNLPVYLSDGEEETDEALFSSEQFSYSRKSTSESSPSSRSSSQKQKQAPSPERKNEPFNQQQYLQQQRDLFFAQQQQGQQPQQQQPPYPNQQQQPPPQQHPYYGAGAYPPPPPMGFYPYGPPPPQYYQYHPSYYPYRSLPSIDTTVPRNPRQPSSIVPEGTNSQETSQQPEQKDDPNSKESLDGPTSEEPNTAGVVYPQSPFDASYYPQTPEQQEQWHIQQLRLLQAQEKYERDMRRQHQTRILVQNVKSVMSMTFQTIHSVRKVATCLCLVAATSYAAVSPRNLPYLEYNQKFYENLQTVALVVVPPLLGYGWLLLDWNQLSLQLGGTANAESSNSNNNNNNNNNSGQANTMEETNEPTKRTGSMSAAIHALINSFYTSFVYGYLWVFALEIVWTTILRLGIFLAWEPHMFGVRFPWSPISVMERPETTSSPNFLILPWALREYKYRPKRITLLAADILTSCVACPIVEEFAKLRLLQWTMPLSKNYSWVKKPSKHNKKNKMKTVAEPIEAATDEKGAKSLDGMVTNINPYIAGMLAVSLGIKWADAIRRVCMYTKIHDEQKSVYAFLRGVFPVQELCGIMTALGLARRDVLGQKMPLWKLLLPATIVHSMANLRGMKPIFKWNSSTPWTEMQLSPDLFPGLFSASALSAMEDAGIDAPLPPTTKLQWFGRAFPKIMWVIILARAAGYCAKNYFMINRQAVRRATTYAGKHAAFSAELETTQKLKNIKDQYNEKK